MIENNIPMDAINPERNINKFARPLQTAGEGAI
jgi:hypothetical protein